MLTKNGFFHVVEAANVSEALNILRERKDYFVLLDSKIVGNEILSVVKMQKEFIIFTDKDDAKTVSLAANLGVNHLMSYPFHSRKLLDKINSLL